MRTIIASIRRRWGKTAGYLLAAVFALATAQFAQGAELYWNGGPGPAFMTESSNWNPAGSPANNNLYFTYGVSPLTVSSDSSLLTMQNLRFTRGVFNIIGDLNLHTPSLCYDTEGESVSVTKEGDWYCNYSFCLARDKNNTTACFTNKTGNLYVHNEAEFAMNGGNRKAIFTMLDGTVTFNSQVRLGGGSGSECTFVKEGGTLVCNKADGSDYYGFSLDVAYGADCQAWFYHNGGTSTFAQHLVIQHEGSGEFYMNGGEVTVGGKAVFGSWYAGSGDLANLYLNGGVFESQGFNYHNGNALANVVFNGGTFKAAADGDLTVSDCVGNYGDYFKFKVAAGGGTIDAGGHAVTMPLAIAEDSSSTGGGMTFKGGGSVTLGGNVGYTGGTTIEAGTTVLVDTAAKKDAILGSGLNTLKFIPTFAGTYTLVTITGGDTFTDGDELKASVADGYVANAVFALSGDKKSLTVTVVGSVATLVFPGATLADLATHTLRARMGGSSFDADGVEATFFNRVETVENDILTKVTYQLQAIDDYTGGNHWTKAAKVEFTADASGVYVKLVDGNYSNYGYQNQFGTDPLDSNPGTSNYIPYDFRLVKPVSNSINVNFTNGGNNIDKSSSVRYGAGDYAVPYTAWVNMPAAGSNPQTIGGVVFTVTGQQGGWGCNNLNGARDVRREYIDDSDVNNRPTITATGVPYEFYRIVVYMSGDGGNKQYGYLTVNGVNYTISGDALAGDTVTTMTGTSAWGKTSTADGFLYGLKEGLNYLVSPVMTKSSATIVANRISASARANIAAIQIVEYMPTTYTVTISDGGSKTFSSLDWDTALPASLTLSDQVVINVNEDTTLTIDSALDIFAIRFNVADGKTLTLAGSNIAAQYITATGAGQTVVASASQLSGTVKGDGTLVYSGEAPSGVTFTDSLWSGVLWLRDGTMNGLLAQNLASANSTLRLTGVTGYFNNGDSEMTCAGALELVDDGATPAFTVSNGFSTNGKTVFAALKGDGTFKSDTTTSQRYVFKDVSAFTGTIDIPNGKNTRVILGNGTSLNPSSGTITVVSGTTATIAAGKTWTAVVSGTGTIAVASGTGTINGFDPSSVLSFTTASGATLVISDGTLTSMTIGALDNQGTIDLTGTALTEATLNLGSGATAATPGTILYPATFEKFVVSPADQTTRALAGFTSPTLPEGVAYYVALAETREEFGKGSMTVTDVASGVNVRVVRPNGTSIEMTPVDGTMTLTETPQIYGAATAFDATYTNTVAYAYRAPDWNAGNGVDVSNPLYNNAANDETTGMYILHHPWVSNVAAKMNALGDFTLVVVGTMSPSHNTQFLHIGNSNNSNKGLLIATTDKDDEVLIAKNTGNEIDVAGGVKASVPNAATARHAYVINKNDTVFEVWVDGVKRGNFDVGEGFVLGAANDCGVQVGSDHGGKIKESRTYEAVPNSPETETGVVNLVRLFDYSISDAQAEAVFNMYPYVSQGGLYTRTVAADGTFSETGAWAKDGAAGTFDVPAGATVDGVYYNPSATFTANAAATIDVNADVVLDTFTVGGTSALRFVSDGTHAVTVSGAAIINSPITNEYGAVYIAGAPVQLGSSGAICFDCSAVDVSKVYEVTRFQLTGLIDQDDSKISFVPPTDPDRSYAVVYNTGFSCYDLVVTPLRNYVVADNQRTTAFTVNDDTIIVGAGGVNIETLASPETGRIVFDPIKTPINVYGTNDVALSVSAGTKFVLTPNYADMALGRIVLLTYKEDYAALPADLSSLLDASSIASGATYAITSEDAPDPSDGRKQLVLTVGDYDRDAKEIRILPVGDSITQGVAANSGNTPQYRSTIAARLAASGYKPKLMGVWKYANYDGSHAMIPEDWAWHSGISAERIIAGGNVGGVRDNMHVYLDIAGDVNAITFLIGTNDIGNGGKTGEEAYDAFTNVVFATAAQRPNAKIIGATILDRGDNTTAKAGIVEFNALLRTDYAANRLPANFVMLDLYDAVPLAESGNFLTDRLHLHWKGCVAAGEAFAGAIMSALPLTGEGAISGAPDPTVTDEEQTALGAAETVPADYRYGMTHVFTIDAAATNAFTSAPYTTIDDHSALSRPVLKAGYYMELVRKGTNRRRYVWVDFDATGKTLGDIDFPWEGENLDFVAEKLHVYSNDPYIHNVAANDDTVSGAVEGTWHNYGSGDDNENVPADVSAGYGWNDTLQSANGYGCFQVHRILSESEAEVLFAWDKWGGEHAASVDEIGIGSFGKSVTLGGSFTMDYTFTSSTTDGAADTLSASAYSVRRVEIWAVFDGAARNGVWSGLGGDADFDSPANWEDGIVPSAGDNVDFSALPAATTISVTGTSAGLTFGTATMGSGVVTFTGEIAFEAISDTSKIAVGANSTVTLDGDLVFVGSGDKYVVYSVAEGGKFVVTGDIEFTADAYLYHSRSTSAGAVQARGLVNNATANTDQWAFRLHSNGSLPANWIVGDHGISGSRYFWVPTGKSVEIRPTAGGFTVSTRTGNHGTLTVNTTDADGNPATITIGDGTNGEIERDGTVNIVGTGKVVANYDVATIATDAGNRVNPFNVQDTATLALNAGANIGTGLVTVNSGATLQVAESVTNTVSSLTLADGAILGFNFTSSKNAPVLEVATSVTLPENGTVDVNVSASGGIRPVFGNAGKYVLTSGGKFKDANVSRAVGNPDWVKGVFVENDEIVVEVSPNGMFFYLR